MAQSAILGSDGCRVWDVRIGAGTSNALPFRPNKKLLAVTESEQKHEVEGRIVRFFLRIRIVFGRNL